MYRYRVLVGRHEGRRPLGGPRRRWEDLQKVGWGMDWIELAQDSDRWHALVFSVNKPSDSIKCEEFLD